MDFDSFCQRLPAWRAAHPDALDCTRTRLHAQALHPLQVPAMGHRCHVAAAWRQRLQWLDLAPDQLLVSQGVRQSLAILMAQWAGQRLCVALPADVYPVYRQLAQRAGLRHGAYALHPRMEVAAPVLDRADVLLVTNPVKPRGSHLDGQEVQALLDWLARDARRRVVVDAVYDLAPGLHAGTRRLFATGQALVLHSLSKAWLAPLLAGVAIVPRADLATWWPAFRAVAPDRARLAQAEAWLAQQPGFPCEVAAAFDAARTWLARVAVARGLPCCDPPGARASGYLLTLDADFDTVLRAGLLGLPDTVFGGAGRHSTVLSALDWVGRTPVDGAAVAHGAPVF